MTNGLQQFQVPNFANQLLQMEALKQQGQEAVLNAATKRLQAERDFSLGDRAQTISEAEFALESDKFRADQESAARKNSIDMNDFALNVLSGVESDEDLQLAKRQFTARFPEQGQLVNQLLPTYSPRGVELIRNSLRDETQRLRRIELEQQRTKPITASPGTELLDPTGKVLRAVPPTPPTPAKQDFELFQKGEDQIWVEKGAKIPEGYKRAEKKGGPSVVVQTGDLGKSTRTQLEKDVVQGVQNIQSFQKTREMFKPEFLTYRGKGGKLVAQAMDKAGIATETQKKLIEDHAAWFRQAKQDFIAYRKWATGVAGGEKEMAEIATAFPDPVKNSPTQYSANLDSIEETTKRILQLNADFLKLGIDMDQPLSVILEQAKEAGLEVPTPPGLGEGQATMVFGRDESGNIVRIK